MKNLENNKKGKKLRQTQIEVGVLTPNSNEDEE